MRICCIFIASSFADLTERDSRSLFHACLCEQESKTSRNCTIEDCLNAAYCLGPSGRNIVILMWLTKLLVSQLQQPLSNEFFSGKPFFILIANKEKKQEKRVGCKKKVGTKITLLQILFSNHHPTIVAERILFLIIKVVIFC